MNPKIKNQGTVSPSDIKAGDVMIATIVCHVRNSVREPGKLAFKLYDIRPGESMVDGVPQGHPLFSFDDTAVGHMLFHPLRALALKHEA